jgi:outer membrane protein assembly factor BamB
MRKCTDTLRTLKPLEVIKTFLALAAFCLLGLPTNLVAGTEPVFEDLGQPVRSRKLQISLVTSNSQGQYTAWRAVEGAHERSLVGIRVDTGKTLRVDLLRFREGHIQMIKARDGNLYLFAGRPGRFLKFDVETSTLTDLGVPDKQSSYWLGNAVGPDGRFYMGTYPTAGVVVCDPATGKIENLGRLPEDSREAYLLFPAVSDDNVIYCPVGLHHQELWSLDLKTRRKQQILPHVLTKAHGTPRVWLGADGKVYGQSGKSTFVCRPDGVDEVKATSQRVRPPQNQAGDLTVTSVDDQGRLHLLNRLTKKEELVATDYPGTAAPIYSIGCVHQGKIYGGTFEPADLFEFDPQTGKLQDLGCQSGGKIQVYDILSHAQGLILASYTGGCLDLFDPTQPKKRGSNPQPLAKLQTPWRQERPQQLCLGPDGRVYVGTVPVKGVLGGALTRVDLADNSVKVWRNIVTNQTVSYLAAVPETGELFCGSSVSGGTSAIPSEKEAVVFLWDVKREAVAYLDRPVPGTKHYGNVVRAANGLIYGIAEGKYYAYDPRKRITVFVGELPVRGLRWPQLSDYPVGEKGLIYGLGDDAVFAINPADHKASVVARHPSLSQAFGFLVTADGTLYYGAHGNLMRCRLPLAAK